LEGEEVVREILVDSLLSNETAAPYESNWEYLSDELKRLDLLIHFLLRHERGREPAIASDSFLDQLRGLVLTEEEISRLAPDPAIEERNDADVVHEYSDLAEALNESEIRIGRRRAASQWKHLFLSLPFIARLFNLTFIEEQVLLICLAPELERKYEKLYGYLQHDVTRKKPTVALILDLLRCSPQEKIDARAVFDSQGPLLKYRLLQISDAAPDGPAPLLGRSLKLDDRIVGLLLGHRVLDARIASCARLTFPDTEWEQASVDEVTRRRTRRFARSHFDRTDSGSLELLFHFHGPYGAGKHALAEAVCHEFGIPMLVCDLEKTLNLAAPFEEAVWLLGREAALHQAAICLENFDCLAADEEKNRDRIGALTHAIRTFSTLTFLLDRCSWKPHGDVSGQTFISLALPIPDEMARKEFWLRECAGLGQVDNDVDWDGLAGRFRFTHGQIRVAVATARDSAAWRDPDDRSITSDDLYAACRAHSNQKLATLARKIQPKYRWPDIVLPADRLQQLREICNHVKYRALVYQEWGFDHKLSLGKGLNALFAGPSGTGKTMSAEIMAGELGLDLYKIDLSMVVSKYIGETEKNLARIFEEAETSNAILFFDEADALFGRRSEVRDSHDRYANIEIGYLLQKMEEYQGVVILATNFRKNMDDAFVRRMHFTVEFPFPGEYDRRRIWEQVWPQGTPRSQDLNLEFMARRFEMAGGNIRNIALSAAFLAAADGRVITMPHLIRATRREYQKMGKVVTEGEFGEYAGFAETH
jgi:SpoVK/Ycf46/Vps4 family AAA+-type ATPase